MERTVQDVIDAVISAVPGAPFPKTVDVIKAGDPRQVVKSAATTFMPTYEVIEQAIRNKIDLIISHEPLYYYHQDETSWLAGDPIYEAKRRLIDEHRIAIWRLHDCVHRIEPDYTVVGLIKALGWTSYVLPGQPAVCRLPPRSLRELAGDIKARLGLAVVRVAGSDEMTCGRIGLQTGARGGQKQIEALRGLELDAVVCGEINEWETAEYIRDAVRMGFSKAVIEIGHSASEEDGMREIIPWLQTLLPGLPITFIPSGGFLRVL